MAGVCSGVPHLIDNTLYCVKVFIQYIAKVLSSDVLYIAHMLHGEELVSCAAEAGADWGLH